MSTSDLFQKSTVPAGKSGAWEVSKFTVSEDDEKFGALRAAFKGHGRFVPADDYTRLCHNGSVVMSDTPDEIRDHYKPVRLAHGSVLIVGLGLGIVAQALLRKPTVTNVTVIEKSPDVISLVEPHIADKNLTVIKADAFTWKPPKGQRWSVAWFDIWDDICADNLSEMTKLKRRFGRRVDWQGCWAEYLCRRYAA